MYGSGIGAIKTWYAGTLFRSRLEARWAAFFDLVGWRDVEYEPVDLRGYIPDFCAAWAGATVAFECKPALDEQELKVVRELVERRARAWLHAARGAPRLALALGPRLLADASLDGEYVLVDCDDHVGVARHRSAGACLVCGDVPREALPIDWVIEQWREAGNCTQWRPDSPRARRAYRCGTALGTCACGRRYPGFAHVVGCDVAGSATPSGGVPPT